MDNAVTIAMDMVGIAYAGFLCAIMVSLFVFMIYMGIYAIRELND